jgi:hypothetical protein
MLKSHPDVLIQYLKTYLVVLVSFMHAKFLVGKPEEEMPMLALWVAKQCKLAVRSVTTQKANMDFFIDVRKSNTAS